MKAWQLAILKAWWLSTSFICYSLLLGWAYFVLNRQGFWIVWWLRNVIKTIKKQQHLIPFTVVSQIVGTKWHDDWPLYCLCHRSLSISDMAAMFSDCTLGEAQRPSPCHRYIYNSCLHSKGWLVLATYAVLSERVQTCDSAHLWAALRTP